MGKADEIIGNTGAASAPQHGLYGRPRWGQWSFKRLIRSERPLDIKQSHQYLLDLFHGKSDKKNGVLLQTDQQRVHLAGDVSTAHLQINPEGLEDVDRIEVELKVCLLYTLWYNAHILCQGQLHTYSVHRTGQSRTTDPHKEVRRNEMGCVTHGLCLHLDSVL